MLGDSRKVKLCGCTVCKPIAGSDGHYVNGLITLDEAKHGFANEWFLRSHFKL